MDDEMQLWWCAECHKVGIAVIRPEMQPMQRTATVVASHKEKSPNCEKPPFSLNLTEIVAMETPDWVANELIKTFGLR